MAVKIDRLACVLHFTRTLPCALERKILACALTTPAIAILLFRCECPSFLLSALLLFKSLQAHRDEDEKVIQSSFFLPSVPSRWHWFKSEPVQNTRKGQCGCYVGKGEVSWPRVGPHSAEYCTAPRYRYDKSELHAVNALYRTRDPRPGPNVENTRPNSKRQPCWGNYAELEVCVWRIGL